MRPKNSSPHANHFHVRIFCNQGDLQYGCKDMGPEWEWVEEARHSFAYHARRLAPAPWAMPRMLAAMERAEAAPLHVVVVGDPAAADTRALVRVVESRLRPDLDLVVVGDAMRATLARLAPFAAALPAQDGRATAYVCVDRACRLPVTDPAALAAALED